MKTKNLRIIIDDNYDNKSLFSIALLLNKVIIGLCRLEITDDGFYLTSIEIAKDFRHKGYGKYLLTETIKILKGMNKYDFKIELIAYPYELSDDDLSSRCEGLVKLLRFYRKFGFKTIKQRLDSASMVLDVIRW